MILEIPVFDIHSAIITQNVGAHRLELCSSISEGGITPSHGTILWAKQHLTIPFFVMIRPRGGGFVYSDEEIQIMKNDIEFCREVGVDGVVFGILKDDGTVDKEKCRLLLQVSKNMQATFHRAFDRSSNPFMALEDIIQCGFKRILTSGLKETAPQGADLIAELVKTAGNRIIIMPGSGVDENNLLNLHNKCNAQEYHSSAKISINRQSHAVNMSSTNQNSIEWSVSAEKIKKMLEILTNFNQKKQ